MAEDTPSSGSRRMFVVPVQEYPDADADYRDGIEKQLETVQAWWADPTRPTDRVFTVVQPKELRERRDLETFLHDSGLRDAAEEDVVVVYLTGHGYRGPSGTHYLLLPDDDPTRRTRYAYPTADVVMAALHSRARHVLVIVNTCFADAVRTQITALVQDLPPQRRALMSLAVVTTAEFDDRPRVREFTTLLRRAHHRLTTTTEITTEDLSITEFLTELCAAAEADPTTPLLQPLLVLPPRPVTETTPCLPNPGYQPPQEVVAPARRQVATTAAELTYWLDRATGRPHGSDPGWYFTGRTMLTRQVASFLRTGAGVLVVTGTAGSGKSAILARAVTLSDPTFATDPRYHTATQTPVTAEGASFAETLPPVGSIDVAVLARNHTPAEILHDLLTGLAHTPGATPPATDPTVHLRGQLEQHLVAHHARTGLPTTIVVDGLDEATEPTRVISDVLAPLARLTTGGTRTPVVRLLVGVRSPRPTDPEATPDGLLDLLHRATTAGRPQQLRTDGPDTHHDIAAYTQALLIRGHGSHAWEEDTRTAVAQVIADRVSPSFLDARLAATRLAEHTHPPAVDDPTWVASLDHGTLGVFRLDLVDIATGLAAHPPDDGDRAGRGPGQQEHLGYLVALLRASAFALGTGITRDLWPTVASAVLDAPIPDGHALVDRVLSSRLAGYLTRDTSDRRVTYRPVHERLAEILRTQAHLLTPDNNPRGGREGE